MLRDVTIGGKCMIRRDRKGVSNNYMTFYEENKPNNVDFWLNIED